MSRSYLVVDDNVAFAENLAEILRDAGAEVEIARSGIEALRLIEVRRFDAMVTDMRMPLMSGAELVREARHHDAGLPAIIITAYSRESDLREAWRLGLLAVLPKPVPIVRLLELVARARRAGLVAMIEDDTDFADNLAEALRERGFSAVTAGSVDEVAHFAGLTPFLALADLRLPGGPDGEALSRLRAGHPTLCTLVVTAYAHESSLPPGQHVFEKPCDTGALLGVIETVYAKSRLPARDEAGR